MDVTVDGGGVESADEVGASVEVGKRRKVFRKGRTVQCACCAGGFSKEAVIEALKKMSEQDRERCIKGVERSCAASEASEIGDKADLNACFQSPAQEDAVKTPCG